MPPRLPPAIDTLREGRQAASAAWSRLLTRPIRLRDGTVLFTLRDAANRILEAPASPSSRVAARRIIDAALRNGDMASTLAAVRLALLKEGPSHDATPTPAGPTAGAAKDVDASSNVAARTDIAAEQPSAASGRPA